MDPQDQNQTTPITHSGHESHEVHLCKRCGWPFPKPHPSSRHRRHHKKVCGTIEGYTTLTGSEVVSDDEHHSSDDDKEKIPSPEIEKKISIESDGGETKGSFARSNDVFTDAVTEFAEGGIISTGSTNKTLDRDMFFSFNDAENAGTNEVSEKTVSPIETIKEAEIETVGDLPESNLELTKTDGVVEPAPEPSHVLQEAKSVDVIEADEEKGQESQISETITEVAKDSEITETTPEVSEIVAECHDNIKQENFDKLEIKQEIISDSEHVSEAVKESETVEEIKIEKLEIAPEVLKGSETDHFEGVGEETEPEKCESDDKNVPEVAKESEIVQTVPVLDEKADIGSPEVVEEPVTVLTEKKVIDEPELEKSSSEQVQEAVKEPVTDLNEKGDLAGSHEVVEKPVSVLIEKDLTTTLESEKEPIQEVVKEPDTVLTEKEDLVEPHIENQSNEHTHEVVEKIESLLAAKQDLGAPESENIVEEPNPVVIEKEDHDAQKSEICSKDEAVEKVIDDRNFVADVSSEMATLKDSSDNFTADSKNASDVPEPIVEEAICKLTSNQESGADLTVDSSSHNSLEGTWGSVSVLSTTSVDAESLQAAEKSKVNSGKSNAATSDVFEAPSFMTLVEPESKDQKSVTSEEKDSQPQVNAEDSQAGWFPTLTNVNNESEGRKRNEEAMEKVSNWSTEKQSTPLKNLLGDAKTPSGKQLDPVVQKDEATVKPTVNDEVSSPPKLIEDDKKGKKGRSLWVPFMCCSSVNAVK